MKFTYALTVSVYVDPSSCLPVSLGTWGQSFFSSVLKPANGPPPRDRGGLPRPLFPCPMHCSALPAYHTRLHFQSRTMAVAGRRAKIRLPPQYTMAGPRLLLLVCMEMHAQSCTIPVHCFPSKPQHNSHKGIFLHYTISHYIYPIYIQM